MYMQFFKHVYHFSFFYTFLFILKAINNLSFIFTTSISYVTVQVTKIHVTG